MSEIRILILSPHTYTYGVRDKYFVCGEDFYLNSNSPEALEELKYILETSQKKGWVYIEEPIVNDYKNNSGVFSQKIDSITISEDSGSVISESEESQEELELPLVEEISEPIIEVITDPKVAREEELNLLHWRELKKIVTKLGLDYLDKETAIVEILNKEFS